MTTIRTLTPEPRPGDEVLVRARVARQNEVHPADVMVVLESHNEHYFAHVTREKVEQVIPADRTRTQTGELVTDVRAAIRQLDDHLADIDREPDSSGDVYVTALTEARAGLVAKLEAVGVAL